MTMTTKYELTPMPKREFQQFRKDYKAQGWDIKKVERGIYELVGKEGTLLIRATQGANAYLIKHHPLILI